MTTPNTSQVSADMVRYRCDVCKEDKLTINLLITHYRDRHFAPLTFADAESMKVIVGKDYVDG